MLTLGVHTSARDPSLFVANGDAILAEASGDGRDPTSGATIEALARQALGEAAVEAAMLDRIVVDVGPGRLSAVRAGVSFANALAFARGLPIAPVISSHAVGLAAEQAHGRVAMAAHKAAAGAGYVAIVEGGALSTLRYGPLQTTLRDVASGYDCLAFAGPEDAFALLEGLSIDAIHAGDASIAPTALLAAAGDAAKESPVFPLNETSAEIDG